MSQRHKFLDYRSHKQVLPQNVSFINGAMTSTVTITFSVMARQAGEFTIPALTADVNGQQLVHGTAEIDCGQSQRPVHRRRQFWQ